MMRLRRLIARYIQPHGGAHNRKSSRKGKYLRYTSSNRATKTRRARPLSARMRMETSGNNVRREERNACHAVKARQIEGLKRGTVGAGGRAICRKTREKARNAS